MRLQAIGRTAALLGYYALIIVIFDIVLNLAGFGYPRHFREENIARFPTPYDVFAGKPDVDDHNEYGFRGAFPEPADLDEDTVSIAFFGGSTGYYGEPTVLETMVSEFRARGIAAQGYNFSSTSSNHSQHVHRLLKYIDLFRFDLVIFYGGGNETMSYVRYDPRPGYPYNFFYRNELTGTRKFLVENSAILGEIDRHTQIITGLSALQREVIDDEDEWADRVIARYARDLDKAKSVAERLGRPNACDATRFVSILQPGNPSRDLDKVLWTRIKALSADRTGQPGSGHHDLTRLEQEVEFTDIIHVTQASRDHIAREMATMLLPLARSCAD